MSEDECPPVNVPQTMDDVEIERSKWKSRRKMAWLSLISIITVTVLILFTNFTSESRLAILSDVITWFYFSCASIIGMYMGATTWASFSKK